jgi:hypothetical protein
MTTTCQATAAAARRPDDRQELALADVEGDALERVHVALRRPEATRHVAHLDEIGASHGAVL